MKRIIVNGWFGWNNAGDEAVLQGILQNLAGLDITIGTSLPYCFFEQYSGLIHHPVVSWDTTLLEYDIHLFGSGGLGYNLPWKQIINTRSKNKKTMIYGGGIEAWDLPFGDSIKSALHELYNLFDAITVRSVNSQKMLKAIGIESVLTVDPAINLESEKWDCPKNYTIVCPRFPDVGNVNEVANFFIKHLSEIKDETILLPFGACNLEGDPIDAYVCKKINEALKIPIWNFNPVVDIKKAKYLISKSKKVITNGRYHALLFAISANVPYQLTIKENDCMWEKTNGLINMHKRFGTEKLKDMEKNNSRILKELGEYKE